MKIKCYWVCPYNKQGICSQPKGLVISICSNGFFKCNKLSQIIYKIEKDLKEYDSN